MLRSHLVSDAWDFDFDEDEDGFNGRKNRMREIDSEYGDEAENWYHKWIEGLVED